MINDTQNDAISFTTQISIKKSNYTEPLTSSIVEMDLISSDDTQRLLPDTKEEEDWKKLKKGRYGGETQAKL